MTDYERQMLLLRQYEIVANALNGATTEYNQTVGYIEPVSANRAKHWECEVGRLEQELRKGLVK